MIPAARLVIADPPYMGAAERNYGPGQDSRPAWRAKPGARNLGRNIRRTTEHSDASLWDDPQTHQDLVRRLMDEADGWAVAMWPTSLPTYLAVAPLDARVAVWYKPNAIPGGRVITSWEPVLVYIPRPRRGSRSGIAVRDVLSAPPPNLGHTGSKPRAWTRWVLDLLAYDPDRDILIDMFPGSGAVTREAAQRMLAI